MTKLTDMKQLMGNLIPSTTLKEAADVYIKPATYDTAGVVRLDPTYFQVSNSKLLCDDLDLVKEKMVLVSTPYIFNNTIYTNGTAFQVVIKASSLLTPAQPLSTCIVSSPELELDNVEYRMVDNKVAITTTKQFKVGDTITVNCFCTDIFGNMSDDVTLHPICRQVCVPPVFTTPVGQVNSVNLTAVLDPPIIVPTNPLRTHDSTDWILRKFENDEYQDVYQDVQSTDLTSKTFPLITLLGESNLKEGVSVNYEPVAKAELNDIVSAVLVTISDTEKYILTIDRSGNLTKADGFSPETFTQLPKSDVLVGSYEVLDMISSENIQPIYQDTKYSVSYNKYNTIHNYAYVLVKFASTTTTYAIYRVDVTGNFVKWATAGNDGHIPRKFNHSVLYRENTNSDYTNTAYGDIINYLSRVSLIGVNCENGYVEFYEPFLNNPTADNSVYPYGTSMKALISKSSVIDMAYGKYRFSYQFLVNDSTVATNKLANVMIHNGVVVVNSTAGFEIYKSGLSETMTMNMYLTNLGHTWLSMDLYSRFISTGDSIVISVNTSNTEVSPFYKNVMYISSDLLSWNPITTCSIVNLPDKYQSDKVAIHLLGRTWTSTPTYYGVVTSYIDGESVIIGIVATTDLIEFYFSEYDNQYSTQIPMVLASKKLGSIVTDKYLLNAVQYVFDLQIAARFNISDIGSSEYSVKNVTVSM